MQDYQEISPEEKEWLIDRSSRITSSQIHKIFMKGKKAHEIFGLTAIDYIREIVFQIRRSDLVDQVNAKQFEFGKENEIHAIDYLRRSCGMDKIIHCSEDGSIIFKKQLGNTFGDSPDYYVADYTGRIYAVGEIKCPYNKVKACEAIDTWTREGCVNEYRHQFVGHFIGNPTINELHYTIYNAHKNRITNKFYDEAVTFIYKRSEFQGLIDQAEYRIPKIHEFIMLCVDGYQEVTDLNQWWLAKDYLY